LWQSLINLIEKIWGDFWKYGTESRRVLSTFMKCGFDLLVLIFVNEGGNGVPEVLLLTHRKKEVTSLWHCGGLRYICLWWVSRYIIS
jgi:hypothetical protein